MNKTLTRVLSAILVLCMIPATFLSALAHGAGVAKDATENQSLDWANNQYIPETIVVDGKFDDTGWPIEDWSYVTASTGNWDVDLPEDESRGLMYQYQLRADHKYFYAAAVVVLPDGIDTGDFVIYISDTKSGGTEYTTAAFVFTLKNGNVTVTARDCYSDNVAVAISSDSLLVSEEKDTNKYYIEFRNAISSTYADTASDGSDNEIRYYVSVNVAVDGVENSLYHPIYHTSSGGHAVPTSEFWPGGGSLLQVTYTDVDVKHNSSQANDAEGVNKGEDGFTGAVELDGKFDESIWKGLTDFYTGNTNEYEHAANANKNLVDLSTVNYLNPNLVAGNSYTLGVVKATEFENATNNTTGTEAAHVTYPDTNNSELTDGYVVTEDNIRADANGNYYTDPGFAAWNVNYGLNFVLPLGNGVDSYELSRVSVSIGSYFLNPAYNGSGKDSNGILEQSISVYYTDDADAAWDDASKWTLLGTVAPSDTTTNRTNCKVVDASTTVMAKKIKICPDSSDSELIFISEICAFSATTVSNGSNHVKYDFRTDDEYFFGAIVSARAVKDLYVNGVKVEGKFESAEHMYRYEFKEKLSDLGITDETKIPCYFSVSENSSGYIKYTNLVINRYDNNASDYFVHDGRLNDDIWLALTAGDDIFDYAGVATMPLYNDVDKLVYDIKADKEYIYGAAILKYNEGGKWDNEYSRFSLYVSPGGTSAGDDDRYIVDMYISNSPDGVQFARIAKISDGDFQTGYDYTYRWSRFSEVVEYGDDTICLEFKVPLKLFGWEGPIEEAVSEKKAPNPENVRENAFDLASLDNDGVMFSYYFGAYLNSKSDRVDATSMTFFSKELAAMGLTLNDEVNTTDAAYDASATKVYYTDMIETVTIDGHIDEEVWQDREFYHASFANSTVINQPKQGEVYDYDYMLYGGSNYIYGAVELNDVAKDDTVFTLWLHNYVDEYAWIDDADDTTPHITYDILPYTEKRSYHTGEVVYTNGEYKTVVDTTKEQTQQGGSVIQYYTNYKYEFNLGKATAAATPNYYFPTDSNLEKDKVWIKEGENYKYAVTTINGKTYLEFMIDVDNFHWDNNSFQYVTSMTHTVDGIAKDETLTIYHPQINDRANFWLTNVNTGAAYRHDATGYFYTDNTNYEVPPTKFWYAFKFTPVANNASNTQYEITDIIYGDSSKYDGMTKAEIYAYTDAEVQAGVMMYLVFPGTMYNQYGKVYSQAIYGGYDELNYPHVNKIDILPVEVNGTTQYINRSMLDGRNKRALSARSVIVNWSKGDIVEFGYQETAQFEDKTENDGKAVLLKSDILDHDAIITDSDYQASKSFYGKSWNDVETDLALPDAGFMGDTLITLHSGYDWEAADSKLKTNNGNILTDGEKLFDGTLDETQTAVLYMNEGSSDVAGDVSASRAQITVRASEDGVAADEYNVFTAYLVSGTWGIDAGHINMEIYGANANLGDDITEWNKITGVSYRQLILRKGDGYSDKATGATNDVDCYTLTAIAQEPVTYSCIKFVFYNASPTNNQYLALQELEVSYSAAMESMPMKNILHLNTNQGSLNINTSKLNSDTYLGRYNTTGATWVNDESDGNYRGVSNVFVTNAVYPGYSHNVLSNTGFYTNFYIERVDTVGVEQKYKPEEETTNNWDNKNSGILKKLEHIAPDVVEVDGNLNDTGWDGTWTEVNGSINATDVLDDGTKFKYQLRADGEFLYVAAVIDAAFETDEPEFTLWLKGDEAATTFTHYYKISKGETEKTITLPTSSNSVDSPYYEYVGEELVNGNTLVLNSLLSAGENGSKTPNGEKSVTALEYLESAIFGYTKEVQESTHDGVWVWEANPVTQGYRFAIEQGCMNSADSKMIGNVSGDNTKTIVEFRIALSEFGGEDGFEYFVEASTANGATIYPHIYSENGYTDYHHPSWAWDSTSAVKVTAEDMTGWGKYRMVNDYAPMTSLGAKINPYYSGDGSLAIRFGARYTEEFIRRETTAANATYWDVADAGIVILPTAMVDAGQALAIDNPNVSYASAQDIINWKNDTADSKTNFADYESFVFYVNLVGIPAGYEDMEFSFCGYVDYYNVTGADTFYGIPLSRSYSLVEATANEAPNLPGGYTVNDYVPVSTAVSLGENAKYYVSDTGGTVYAPTEEDYIRILTDGAAASGISASSGHGQGGYAVLYGHTDPINGTAPAQFSLEFEYEEGVVFNAVNLGVYTYPEYCVGTPSSVDVYVKEDGEWVYKETKTYTMTAEKIAEIGKNHSYSESVLLKLDNSYTAEAIKVTVNSSAFVHVEGVNNGYKTDGYKYDRYVGLTEIALAYTN